MERISALLSNFGKLRGLFLQKKIAALSLSLSNVDPAKFKWHLLKIFREKIILDDKLFYISIDPSLNGILGRSSGPIFSLNVFHISSLFEIALRNVFLFITFTFLNWIFFNRFLYTNKLTIDKNIWIHKFFNLISPSE